MKHDNDSELMQRATDSSNLKERADVNRSYASNDFDAWTDSLLNKIHFTSVLDVCCGTGNQLLKYAGNNNTAHLIGVDVSKESLNTAETRLKTILGASKFQLKPLAMEDLFDDPELAVGTFDLISCFYGLYYSRNVAKTLFQMIDHLTEYGTILIVGPYGKNNSSLFEILQKYFFLPDLVLRSSTTFMENEVLPILSKRLKVQTETFINPIRYPNAKVLIDYWRASTFYFPSHEKDVILDIEAHIAKYGEFIVEKHVMAYLARKA